MIDIYGISDVGCVRQNNEDRLYVDKQLGLCLLADGMGGHGHGELAAELAVRVSHHFIAASKDRFDVTWPFGYDYSRTLDENRLMNAIQLANRQIWNATRERPECAGMGTTLIAVTVEDDQSVIGSVGDSHVYLLRDGQIQRLSTDDSWVGDLVRKGALTEEAARSHPRRNVLTQAVGVNCDLDVHTCVQLLLDGDALLLATDGIHGVLEPGSIRSILHSFADVRLAAQKLIDAAKEAGAPDNASCIVLRYHCERSK